MEEAEDMDAEVEATDAEVVVEEEVEVAGEFDFCLLFVLPDSVAC